MIKIIVKQFGWRHFPEGKEIEYPDEQYDELKNAEDNGLITIVECPDFEEELPIDKLNRNLKDREDFQEE